jgi:E1-E2 ATPase, putative
MKCLKSDEVACLNYEQVADKLDTNLQKGLTWREAESRLRIFGYNEFRVKKEDSIFSKYIEQV